MTALSISLAESLLLAGTATGLVHLYAIASHQLLRTISTHRTCRYPALLIYPDLIGYINLSLL
jgi:pre-rRNA-processing protein IPI3